MRMDLNLGQKQHQVLKLSPRMIHSMEVLQLPVAALMERVDKELQENPFLEAREHLGHEKTPVTDGQVEKFNPDAPLAHDADNQLDFNRLESLDRQLGGLLDEENRPSRAARQEMSDKKLEAMNNMPDRPPSLQDHLTEQLGFLNLSADARDRVEYLIYNLDKDGRLAANLEELAFSFGKETQPDQWEEALEVLQTLEPAGVGARDLKECLFLQIDENTPHGDILRVLIRSHLEDIQHNRYPIIQKQTGYDIDTIQEAVKVLKTLNPRPAAEFEVSSNHFVSPDILVTRDEDGDYEIKLTDDRIPKIYINRKYMEMYKNGTGTEKEKEYMRKNLQSASLLLSSIEQRRTTLEKVARAIINHQKAFLDKGSEYIEPLKMQQIADQVKVHVTTISRAVDDKWIQTPRGVFPLKRFFGGGTKNEITGEEVAYEKIKQELEAIIDSEDKSKPYSDEDIVETMNSRGYPVARRTVTKYRKQLNIPSSRERKEWKNK
ncbi:RNA polymerase factor sigma-54 [Telmatocola sphagniphila]|uniref:RNA polymerase factor sigma-54 n=2 Tax=Telmatocola sphagniphila TaxID=1123043 RepID=A0A8E6F0T1_9BACT|nr:RNA polymerase factor sigma-54 [Telmatocola sphagniphila]